MSDKYAKFSELGFEDFRKMALDDSLSCNEKTGFPDEYRRGFEEKIVEDICSKLPAMNEKNKVILDIGPGCSELPKLIIERCQTKESRLYLVDSREMLDLLPDGSGIRKIDAYYPNCKDLFEELAGRVDAIICYSVFHYIFAESNIWNFLDRSLDLLASGGAMLIGDIPNVSMRKRFFSSHAGIEFHKDFMNTTNEPEVQFNCVEFDKIDDSVVQALVMRSRLAGFNAYVMPQGDGLPMSNRREDVLIVRP